MFLSMKRKYVIHLLTMLLIISTTLNMSMPGIMLAADNSLLNEENG